MFDKFKDILIPLTGDATDDAALAFAAEIAREHEAHLAVLITVALIMPISFEMAWVPSDLYSEVHDVERKLGEQRAEKARGWLRSIPISWEVRIAETFAMPSSGLAALHARYADVTVIAGGAERSIGAPGLFADLLAGSGRPVLVFPPSYVARAPRARAVVAWQPTREASRAAHDALPLLRRFAQVDVLVVDPQVDATHHGDVPGADISTHLARHGITTNVVTIPSMGETVEQAILRFAGETGAELIVAGGYSHSRLREHILGGVTLSLFERAGIPVLFSH